MTLIIDLHTHSYYSRATSKESTLEGLFKWGKIKGIDIIGTGDFTHPGWFAEIREKLEPAEPGLFKLKDQFAKPIDSSLPQLISQHSIRFVLTVEISNIYSKKERVRKLHHLVVSPSFESVSAINSKLERIGNLKADGRPILGLDSKELLKIVLGTDPDMLFIPAHIWTPWFSLFGSHSGFDSLEEGFEELSSEITAIETGLSSDPFMNWRLPDLEKRAVISNSDAHSPKKLGREATVLNSKLDYYDIINGIKTNDERLVGTIEFFPEEGKYHYDGHREHGVRLKPQETKKLEGLCPICHKPLTIGVDHRVDDLAIHPADYKPLRKRVEYIIPLPEIIAELKGVGAGTKAVSVVYERLFSELGTEFEILRRTPIEDIRAAGFGDVAYAVDLMRKGKIHIEPGYDGVYGVIKIFSSPEEREKITGQLSLI